MKVTDIIAQRDRDDEPYYTFEIFPPKTSQGMTNLLTRLQRMVESLRPSWIHVTWSAGGTSSEKSLDLARSAIKLGVEVCLHLTCTNMERQKLDETLDALKEAGIQNVLALRGDAPRGEEYWIASDPMFQHGSDLVKYIRQQHGDYFCIGVAGYPEGHCDSSNKQVDTKYLLAKQEAGADFIVTQLFYDNDAFDNWYTDARQNGVNIPILPGIMPIQTFGGFSRMTHMCKTFIPDHVIASLEPIKGDDAAVKDYGVDLAAQMIRELYEIGVRGFHFCTLNLEKSVQRILEELQWANRPHPATKVKHGSQGKSNGRLTDPRLAALKGAGNGDPAWRTDSPTSWDEYPNGRFGDARSPAYGDLDGWGISVKLTPSEALKCWGRPESYEDISRVFARYLEGTLSAIPWSEEPLRDETNSILQRLLELNTKRNWWTVGSQPAVDGVSSEDPVHGFGPAGGYVYQKAFVEFFCDYEDVLEIKRRAEAVEKQSQRRKVTFYAASAATENDKALITNMQTGDANAVTWGIFPGKEIVTTTLIEEMSFTAWKEEAFSIWTEWEHLYPLNTPARKLLQAIGQVRWLVSVVHHDYKDAEGLWDFLMQR